MRGVWVAWVALAVAVVAIVAAFAWPGFLAITHCEPSQGPSETLSGRTYCIVALTFPTVPSWASFVAQCHNATIDHTVSGPTSVSGVWGFTFSSNIWVNCSLVSGLNVTIVEPSRSAYATSIDLVVLGVPPNGTAFFVSECLSTWIAPDGEAGVSCNTTPQAVTASALIEAGT